MTTDEEYRAMAADAMAKIPEATSDQERARLRRANAAYLKLATHRTEAAARAELKPPRITSEKADQKSAAKRLATNPFK